MAYDNMLLNLKPNVLFVGFYDHVNQRQMGKVVRISRHGLSFKPDNATAAMLLYLLCREAGDEIHFNTLKQVVMQKTGFSDAEATTKLNAFLELLNSLNLLTTAPANGRPGTDDADPKEIFVPGKPQSNWNWTDPTLTQSNPVNFRVTHGYSDGYYMITIRR